MEYIIQTQISIDELLMSDGVTTAAEWLQTQPEGWRKIETDAIYECLRNRWMLHEANIQCAAREIGAKPSRLG